MEMKIVMMVAGKQQQRLIQDEMTLAVAVAGDEDEGFQRRNTPPRTIATDAITTTTGGASIVTPPPPIPLVPLLYQQQRSDHHTPTESYRDGASSVCIRCDNTTTNEERKRMHEELMHEGDGHEGAMTKTTLMMISPRGKGPLDEINGCGKRARGYDHADGASDGYCLSSSQPPVKRYTTAVATLYHPSGDHDGEDDGYDEESYHDEQPPPSQSSIPTAQHGEL
jgi:hypothetical protein